MYSKYGTQEQNDLQKDLIKCQQFYAMLPLVEQNKKNLTEYLASVLTLVAKV
jgi:hypothetical protein